MREKTTKGELLESRNQSNCCYPVIVYLFGGELYKPWPQIVRCDFFRKVSIKFSG